MKRKSRRARGKRRANTILLKRLLRSYKHEWLFGPEVKHFTPFMIASTPSPDYFENLRDKVAEDISKKFWDKMDKDGILEKVRQEFADMYRCPKGLMFGTSPIQEILDAPKQFQAFERMITKIQQEYKERLL